MGDPIPFREFFPCPLRLQSPKQSSLRGDSCVRVEIDIRGIVVREGIWAGMDQEIYQTGGLKKNYKRFYIE